MWNHRKTGPLACTSTSNACLQHITAALVEILKCIIESRFVTALTSSTLLHYDDTEVNQTICVLILPTIYNVHGFPRLSGNGRAYATAMLWEGFLIGGNYARNFFHCFVWISDCLQHGAGSAEGCCTWHSGHQPLNSTMSCCRWYNGCTSQKWPPLGLRVEPAIAIKWIFER